MTSKLLAVMEIQRFALHDGAGIRSLIFLQGCPLHCPWCANPESQKLKKQILWNKSKCTTCHVCEKNCPTQAITFKHGGFQHLLDRCNGCEQCKQSCSQDAICVSGKQMSIEQILCEVKKDDDYYKDSNGGITISGGEAFVQYEGFLTLIKTLKEKGYHTCVETCGHVPQAHMVEAVPYIDGYLFDMKHTNAALLAEVTGGDLSLIMKNLKYLASLDPSRITIRVPIIPSFNDDEATIVSIFELAQQLQIKEVHLLPYHTLGKNKYAQLGRTYELEGIAMLTKQDLQPYVQRGAEFNLIIKIGG